MVDVLRFFWAIFLESGQHWRMLGAHQNCRTLQNCTRFLWVSLAGSRRHQRRVTSVSTGDLLRVDAVSLKEKQSCCLGLSLTELGLQQNRNRWNSDSTKKHRGTPRPIWSVKSLSCRRLCSIPRTWHGPKLRPEAIRKLLQQSIKQNHQVRRFHLLIWEFSGFAEKSRG